MKDVDELNDDRNKEHLLFKDKCFTLEQENISLSSEIKEQLYILNNHKEQYEK